MPKIGVESKAETWGGVWVGGQWEGRETEGRDAKRRTGVCGKLGELEKGESQRKCSLGDE